SYSWHSPTYAVVGAEKEGAIDIDQQRRTRAGSVGVRKGKAGLRPGLFSSCEDFGGGIPVCVDSPFELRLCTRTLGLIVRQKPRNRNHNKISLIGWAALSTIRMGRPTLDASVFMKSMPSARHTVAKKSATETGRSWMLIPSALVRPM